ncbi:MAG: hypothetical protein EOS26_21440 [Mesorhizobium sp.]|nr:MAG: hypothetical protein EOS26_21440 [Mesorhizobium sp.]
MTGYSLKHPERSRTGSNPPPEYADPIGDPLYLVRSRARGLVEFADSLPWLNRSHRGILSIASLLAGRLTRGDLGTSRMKSLWLCLGSAGATPADFCKLEWSPPLEDDDDDEAAAFFR